MAAVDPSYVPRIDEKLLQLSRVPASSIRHGADEPETRTTVDPEGNVRTINDRILDAARSRYKKLVYRSMYPYGYDFVVNQPNRGMADADKTSATSTAGSGFPKGLRRLKQRLWKKSYRHAHRKITGGKLKGAARKRVPPMPKLKALFGRGPAAPAIPPVAAAATSQTAPIPVTPVEPVEPAEEEPEPMPLYITEGTGITARGITARGVTARGYPPHAAMAEINADEPFPARGAGFDFIGTALTMAAPLVLQGAQKITDAIHSGVENAKRAKYMKMAAERERLAHSTPEGANPAAAPPAGSGPSARPPPTPAQMESARQVAEAASLRGLVGFPNPYAMIDPRRGMLRQVINLARQGLIKTAHGSGMPPHRAVPFVDKFLKHYVKRKFGPHAMHSIMRTAGGGIPMKRVSAGGIVSDLIYHVVGPHAMDLLYHILGMPELIKPVSGSGVGDVLSALYDYVTMGAPMAVSAVKDLAAEYIPQLGEYVGKLVRRIIPEFGSNMSESELESFNVFPPVFDPQPSTSYARPPSRKGKEEASGEGFRTVIRGGNAILDILGSLAKGATAVAAPVAAAFLGEKFGGDSKAVKKAFGAAGEALSGIMGEELKLDRVRQAEQEAMDKFQAEQREAMKEYKEMRAASPQDSEQVRQLIEMLKGLRPPEKPTMYSSRAGIDDIMGRESKPRAWRMVPSEVDPTRKRREYLYEDERRGSLGNLGSLGGPKAYKPGAYLRRYSGVDEDEEEKMERKEHKRIKKARKAQKLAERMAEEEAMQESLDPDDFEEWLKQRALRDAVKKSKKAEKRAKKHKKHRMTPEEEEAAVFAKARSRREEDVIRGLAKSERKEALRRWLGVKKRSKPTRMLPGDIDPKLEAELEERDAAEQAAMMRMTEEAGGEGMRKLRRESVAKQVDDIMAAKQQHQYVYKPVGGLSLAIGPTTADAIRGRQRAMTVMTLSKKIAPPM